MAREFSVIVSIDAKRAVAGGRTFKQGADQVARSSAKMRRGMDRSRRSATALITTIGRMRGVATLAFAGFLGVGGLSAVVRTLSQFQTSISAVTALISAQNPRSLGGAMSALTDKARELGATTLFTATQAAEGMKFLTLAGFDALEVYQAIEPALNLAAAGMLGLGESADIVSNIMAAFNVEASEVETVVDALAFTAARTNTNIRQLGEAMKFVGPVAGTLGVNVEETAVALGILGNSGLQASLAGTSLRRVMSGLLNPSKEAHKVFAQLGVTQDELVDTLQGEKGLVNLIKLLAKQGISAADAFLLFGQRGAPGLLSLVTQVDKLELLTDGLENISGVARRMAKIMADNLGGDARIAISALQEAILRLGDSGLGNWLRESVQGFTGFIRALSGVVTPLEDLNESMLKGINVGTTFRENWELIKAAVVGLALFLSRNLIKALALTIANMAVASANALGLAFSFTSTARGAGMAAAGILSFRAALMATGIGIAFVATGALVNWLMGMDDATESTRNFNEVLDETSIAGENLAIVFHTMTTRDREWQMSQQQNRIDVIRDEMKELTDALWDQDAARLTLTATQNAYNEALEAEGAIDTGPSKLENLNAHNTATQNLIDARMDLNAAEKAGALDREFTLHQLDVLAAALAEEEQLRRDLIAVHNGEAESVQALRAAREGEIEKIEEANALHKEAFGFDLEEKAAIEKLLKSLLKETLMVEKLTAEMALLELAAQGNAKALLILETTTDKVAEAQEVLAFKLRKAANAMNPLEKAAKTLREKFEDLEDSGSKLAQLERKLARESANLIQEWIEVGDQSLDLAAALRDLQAEFERNRDELDKNCDSTKKLKECMSESAKAMQTIWDQALRNIQDAFADAFEGAFDSFESFAEKLFDAFKTLIANILAEAAILNIFGGGNGFFADVFTGLSQGFGGGGAGAVANATGNAAGGSGTANGIFGPGTAFGRAFSSFAAGASAFFQGAASFLTGAGGAGAVGGSAVTSMPSVFNTGAQNAALSNPGSFTAGGAFAGAGIGAITGAVADAIMGSRGDSTRNAIFSAIGGAIGSIWGPIGSVIGGAIGSLIDNLFGGARALESAVLEVDVAADQWFGTQTDINSRQRSWFRGREFTTTITNVTSSLQVLEDVFVAFAGILETGAETLGGNASGFLDDFSATLRVDLMGRTSEQISQVLANFLNDTMLSAIAEWLRDVEGLEPHVHTVLRSFANDVEEFVTALDLLGVIGALFDIALLEASTEAIEESQMGIVGAYQLALDGYREIIASYDGSIESLELLTNATAVMIQVQLDLITVYQQTGDAISSMFLDSAQAIRESLLSDEELYNLRQDQIEDLILQASMTTDPEELLRIAQELNELGIDAFNLLTEDQREELGPEFIEFFEMLDDLFGGQINEGIEGVLADQAALDEEVSVRMLAAAEALLAAAAALADAYGLGGIPGDPGGGANPGGGQEMLP